MRDPEVERAAHDRAARLERPVGAEVLPEPQRDRRQQQPAAAAAAVEHAVVASRRPRRSCDSLRCVGGRPDDTASRPVAKRRASRSLAVRADGPGMPSGRTTRPTVLVCDDEPVLRMLVRATLDDGPHRIVEACDGEQALERVRSDSPDVILLDIYDAGPQRQRGAARAAPQPGDRRHARDHAHRARPGRRPRGDEPRRRHALRYEAVQPGLSNSAAPARGGSCSMKRPAPTSSTASS